MIVDSQTNFVYLADSLARKYPKFARRLTSAFDENAVRYDFLPNTKDVWAVDYMPVQVAEDEFIRFNYSPDYLTSKKYAKTISDVDTICTELGIETTKTDIIADGGNLVRGQDYVMMTEKIFYENKKYKEQALEQELLNLLQVKDLIIIPWEKGDWLGHSDGAVRVVSGREVLINDIANKRNKDHQNLIKELEYNGISWSYFTSDYCNNKSGDDARGLYLNYLELEDFIFLPVFNRDKDIEAIDLVEKYFPTKKVVTIPADDLAQSTGVINCCTWNVLK
jgi:agmatine deiminase